MAINDFFVWGKGGEKLTPEQVKRQQMQAQALQKQGVDFSPAGHWSVALGRGLSGFMGGLQERRANEAENAGIASANEAFNNSGIAELLMGGGAAPQSYAPQEYSSTSQVSDRSTPQPRFLNDANSTSALSAYLTPDKDKSHLNFEGDFASRMESFLAAAPGGGISIYSGYRPPERQAQLWEAALKKYGSPEAARKWVAPPGRSNHNHGTAADLRYASDAQKRWAHENAAKYGLHFRLGNEPWHIEPIQNWKGAGQQPVQVASADPNFMPDVSSREIPLTALQPSPVAEALAPQQTQAMASPAAQPSAVSEALLAPNIAPQQQRTAPNMAAILQLANNPYLNDTQRTILGSVLQQQMQANDPLRALQLQQAQQGLTKGQLEIEAMQQPKAPEYGFQTLGDGTVVRTNKATGEVIPAYEGTPKPTPDVQNYEYAANNPGFAEYQQQLKRAGASSTNVNVGGEGDAYQKKFWESMGAAEAKSFTDAMETGDVARRNKVNLDRLSQLAASSPQGLEGAVVNTLSNMGIKLDGAGKVEAMESLISQLVPSQRPPGSGTISDADLALYKASLPRIINSPEGNQLILETLYAINQHDIAASEIAAMVSAGELSPTEARKEMRKIPNPFDDWQEKVGAINSNTTSTGKGGRLGGNRTSSGVTWSVN